MIGAEGLSTLIPVPILMLVIAGVDGSRHSCPVGAVVDLTKERGDSFGYVNKSDLVYPPESRWEENGRKFGCPCEIKTCIRLCCPGENATSEDDCVKDLDTFGELITERFRDSDIHLFSNEPCSMNDSLIKQYHDYREDLFTNTSDLQESDNVTLYCRDKEWDLILYLVARCADEGGYHNSLIWYLCSIDISTLFVLATFIVYAVIPELRNLKASIFLSYLASLICHVLIFTTCVFLRPSKPTNFFEVVTNSIPVFGFFYFVITTMLWLNVMSFDIWTTFRNFQPIIDTNDLTVKKQQKRRFIQYAFYAWGTPAVYILCIIISTYMRDVPLAESDIVMTYYLQLFLLTSYFIVSICNACFYIATALTIKKCKKETSHIVDGANKHQQENEQWFNLYWKLFVIMGGDLIFWTIGNCLHNKIFWRFVYLTVAMQGIVIFLMFVWKDDVKQSLRKRFAGMLRTLSSVRRPDPTPDIENPKMG